MKDLIGALIELARLLIALAIVVVLVGGYALYKTSPAPPVIIYSDKPPTQEQQEILNELVSPVSVKS